MTPQMQQQLLDGLKAVAEKLGVAAQSLWALYVRQAVVNGLECAFCSVLVLWMFFSTVKQARLAATENDGDGFAGWCVAAALTLAGFVAFGVNAVDLLANPQYWAFKNLLEAVRG